MHKLALLAFSSVILATSAALAQNVPLADAGDDVTVECAGPDGTSVQLDGSGSSDPDGAALGYRWTSPSFAPGTELTGATPTAVLPLGTHVITLEVDDGVDGSALDQVNVTVQDSTPPVLQVGGTPLSLWPPNHVYHNVDIERFVIASSDTCDDGVVRGRARFGSVTSDEPENGTGDGDTPVDIRLRDECRRLQVRAERKGNGDGRVYEAEIVVEDGSGNTSSEVVVVARVAKAPPKPAIDSGDAYTVTPTCEPDGPGLCPLQPDPSCAGIMPRGRAYLMLFAHPRSDRFDGLRFMLSGIGSPAAHFGDPTQDTDYQLCVYGRPDRPGEAFGLLMNPEASAGAAWAARRDSFLYRMRPGQDDGLNLVSLRAAPGGRGAIAVIGSGRDLGMPELPLDASAGVEVQLHNSLGRCWAAHFPEALRSTGVLYQAVEH